MKYLSPLKASATLGIALIVSYVQVRHATIQANGTLENVDQSESMFKFRGEFYFLTKSGRQFRSKMVGHSRNEILVYQVANHIVASE